MSSYIFLWFYILYTENSASTHTLIFDLQGVFGSPLQRGEEAHPWESGFTFFFFDMCFLIDSYAYLHLPQEDTAVCRWHKHRGCCGPFVEWACTGSQKRLLADIRHACLRVQSTQSRVGVSPLQTTLTSALCRRARAAWPFGMPQQDLSLRLTKWPAWVFSY